MMSVWGAGGEVRFGVWGSRSGLEMKTRALICGIAAHARARWEERARYLVMERNTGWTEDDLTEALLHLCVYIGLPSVREALLVAKELFHEMRKEK